MKTKPKHSVDLGLSCPVFDWSCPNCLGQLFTDGVKMFCKPCNIEYDESEEGIKKYCNDFEERELKDTLQFINDHTAEYHELIMAVESKYPGESRHKTALRYIKDRETKITFPGVGPILPPSAVS